MVPGTLVGPDAGSDRSTESDIPMNSAESKHARWKSWGAWLALPASLLLTGCQVDMAGQTLPSPYYLTDDVQYYAPGPGFKLAREAAAMQQQEADQVSQPSTGY
jgi:hypothetical protein